MFWTISPKLLELFHTRTIGLSLSFGSQQWSGSCQRKLSAAIFSGRFSGGLTMPYDVNRKHSIYRVYICVPYTSDSYSTMERHTTVDRRPHLNIPFLTSTFTLTTATASLVTVWTHQPEEPYIAQHQGLIAVHGNRSRDEVLNLLCN